MGRPIIRFWCLQLLWTAAFSFSAGVTALCANPALTESPKAPLWALQLDTESVSTLFGGLHSGTLWDTKLLATVHFGTNDLGLWQGGRFEMSGVALRSGLPSLRSVGDIQGLSNIEAPSSARVYELWYRQDLRIFPVALQAGIIDLNQNFCVTDGASLLLNSSFGIMPTISANAPTSIFPKPGWGAFAERTRGSRRWRVGMFQGDPGSRNSVRKGGAMAIGELDLSIKGDRGAGVLKGGLWSHGGGGRPGDWGAYLLAERPAAQLAWMQAVLFCQAGASPPSGSSVPYYLAAGVDLQGPLPSRPSDHLVAGFARAWLRHRRQGAETSWEITYVLHLSRSLSIQPDLQYVVHPGGRYPDALAVLIRLGVRLH